MSAPLEVTGSAAEAHPEALTEGVGTEEIQGRSLGQIAWRRLRRDRVALGGAAVIVLLILVAIFAPLIVAVFGHAAAGVPLRPGRSRPAGLPEVLRRDQPRLPVRRRAGQRPRHLQPGRLRRPDLVAHRVPRHAAVGGRSARSSGVVAGYFGGWVDTLISRTMDVFLAFPLLLFAIALVGVIPDQAFGLQGDTLRIVLHHRDHRLLQLAVHRPDHPWPDAVAARARVRRRRPQPRRPHAATSSSASCCPT